VPTTCGAPTLACAPDMAMDSAAKAATATSCERHLLPRVRGSKLRTHPIRSTAMPLPQRLRSSWSIAGASVPHWLRICQATPSDVWTFREIWLHRLQVDIIKGLKEGKSRSNSSGHARNRWRPPSSHALAPLATSAACLPETHRPASRLEGAYRTGVPQPIWESSHPLYACGQGHFVRTGDSKPDGAKQAHPEGGRTFAALHRVEIPPLLSYVERETGQLLRCGLEDAASNLNGLLPSFRVAEPNPGPNRARRGVGGQKSVQLG